MPKRVIPEYLPSTNTPIQIRDFDRLDRNFIAKHLHLPLSDADSISFKNIVSRHYARVGISEFKLPMPDGNHLTVISALPTETDCYRYHTGYRCYRNVYLASKDESIITYKCGKPVQTVLKKGDIGFDQNTILAHHAEITRLRQGIVSLSTERVHESMCSYNFFPLKEVKNKRGYASEDFEIHILGHMIKFKSQSFKEPLVVLFQVDNIRTIAVWRKGCCFVLKRIVSSPDYIPSADPAFNITLLSQFFRGTRQYVSPKDLLPPVSALEQVTGRNFLRLNNSAYLGLFDNALPHGAGILFNFKESLGDFIPEQAYFLYWHQGVLQELCCFDLEFYYRSVTRLTLKLTLTSLGYFLKARSFLSGKNPFLDHLDQATLLSLKDVSDLRKWLQVDGLSIEDRKRYPLVTQPSHTREVGDLKCQFKSFPPKRRPPCIKQDPRGSRRHWSTFFGQVNESGQAHGLCVWNLPRTNENSAEIYHFRCNEVQESFLVKRGEETVIGNTTHGIGNEVGGLIRNLGQLPLFFARSYNHGVYLYHKLKGEFARYEPLAEGRLKQAQEEQRLAREAREEMERRLEPQRREEMKRRQEENREREERWAMMREQEAQERAAERRKDERLAEMKRSDERAAKREKEAAKREYGHLDTDPYRRHQLEKKYGFN